VFFVGGSLTSNASFTVTSGPPVSTTPKITSFNPTSGPGNTRVTVFGENLGGTNTATIAGRTCILLAILPTQVVMDLPGNAVTGRIVLSGADGTATSPTDFTVTQLTPPPPGIADFNPKMGGANTPVTITGVNFESFVSLKLGTLAITPTLVFPDRIDFVVPQGAVSGRIEVKTQFGTATTSQDFVVQQPVPMVSTFMLNPTQPNPEP
jgi:hypothetical protein